MRRPYSDQPLVRVNAQDVCVAAVKPSKVIVLNTVADSPWMFHRNDDAIYLEMCDFHMSEMG